MKSFLIKWYIFFAIIFSVVGYYEISVKRNFSGDLGFLGHIPFGKEYDDSVQVIEDSLPPHIYINIDSASVFSMIMIGDSFCEPVVGLCQYISKEVGDTVRTIYNKTIGGDYVPVNTLLYGLENKLFHSGQTVILEVIERSSAFRFSNLDSEKTDTFRVSQINKSRTSYVPDINDFLTWFRLMFGYNSPVRHHKLVRPMFTHKQYADDLWFYADDLVACNVSEELLDSTVTNIKKLMSKAEEQGIKLYILVIPDKYEFYHPYIVDINAPTPNALAFINKTGDNRIINARDTLAPLLEQGEMDVWRVNDSHWGVKASKYIGKKIANHIKADSILHLTLKSH